MAKVKSRDLSQAWDRVTNQLDTPHTIQLGMEWEISGLYAWNDAGKFFTDNFWSNTQFHNDGDGLEVQSPVGNLNYQRRWIKQVRRMYHHPKVYPYVAAYYKPGEDCEWDNLSGIHVHASVPAVPSTVVRQRMWAVCGVAQDYSSSLRGTNKEFFRFLSHRLSHDEYIENTWNVGINRGHGTTEYRLFNSHELLLEPAVEFAHSMTTYVTRREYNDADSLEDYIAWLSGNTYRRNLYARLIPLVAAAKAGRYYYDVRENPNREEEDEEDYEEEYDDEECNCEDCRAMREEG